jgi:sarcosine oxidase, subunit gamma
MAKPIAKAPAARQVDLSWLERLPEATRLSFRGAPEAAAAASRVFGAELPTTACRAGTSGSRAALWLGPDEHLLMAPEADGAKIVADLASALAGIPHSVVDVSHRQSGIAIKGPHAAWLLESACPLDLDLREFPVGMCTRTLYAKAEILLWRTGPEAFHIEVWRSFAEYVIALLTETALELPA